MHLPMLSLVKPALIGLPLVLLGCCASERSVPEEGAVSPSAFDEAQESLTLPPGRSIPCTAEFEPAFPGNELSVLVLDAYASCASSNVVGASDSAVKHFDRLWPQAMDMATRAGYQDVLRLYEPWSGFDRSMPDDLEPLLSTWLDLRNGDYVGESAYAFNCIPDPRTLRDESLPKLQAPNGFGAELLPPTFELLAGPVELCVAQRLRESAPGTAGAEAVLFTDDEQRQLLATVRDHAQQAMLQFALVFAAVATPRDPADVNLTPSQMDDKYESVVVPWLQRWAHLDDQSPTAQHHIDFAGRMRDDFAAAVQLHVQVTRELAELMARSRSANTPIRSSLEGTRADKLWGPESWQQRLMALMYGGDPMVNTEDGTWVHRAVSSFPEPLKASFRTPELNSGSITGWLPAENFSYLDVSIDQPQVWTLIAIARNAGALSLDVDPASGRIDTAATADSLYVGVERRLRRCDPCAPPVLSTDTEDTLLWQRHRITREHAGLAAHLLERAIGSSLIPAVEPADFSDPWGAGMFNLGGDASSDGTFISFSDDAELLPRSLRQIAPAFTTNATFQMVGTELMRA